MPLTPSVCIDAVFEGLSFDEACAFVESAGIPAIEFWGWWDKDLDRLEKARDKHGLTVSACCTGFVSLVDPALRGEYLSGLEDSIQTAKRLQTEILISQVGDFRVGIDRKEQHQSLVDGLCAAAPLLEAAGITLVVEPFNELVDHAGYYLVRSDEAFDIIDEVGSSQVKVVFDVYHQQISEGHLIHNISSNIDKIGHFHAAGNPGRNELQRGEINYPNVFAAINELGFHGYVGLEYWPSERNAVPALQEVSEWLKYASKVMA